LITFAPTRSGKGVGHVIPNLLDHPGSVVVNDIKGENYAVSGRHRAQFSKVITFAPFMEGSGCFNPIDFIRINTSDELDDAALIADMIIVPGGGDEFWTNEAKTVITGLILYVANESPAALRNLGEVRYLIMQDQKDFQLTIKDMQRSKNQIIQRIANSVAATEPKVLASVLSTAKSQTAVWDSPRLTSITSRSDFKLEDIKKEPTSFYVIIPPEYLDVYKPVVRLMMGITIATLTRTQEKPKDPTLFIIDEFPALGYMKNIESGVGYLAGYGISLWMFIQDLSQIKEDYPKWASLIANCSVRMAFGTNDFDTAKILSDMMGTTTVRVAGEGTSKEKGQWFGGNVSSNVSETSRPLMTPDEVMRMPNDAQVIFVQGCRPVLAEKIRYYADPEFKGKFDAW
jgi:type IV secretion system protein VirD4